MLNIKRQKSETPTGHLFNKCLAIWISLFIAVAALSAYSDENLEERTSFRVSQIDESRAP